MSYRGVLMFNGSLPEDNLESGLIVGMGVGPSKNWVTWGGEGTRFFTRKGG